MKTTSKNKLGFIIGAAKAITGSGALILALTGCAGDTYNRSTGEYIDDNTLQLRVGHALGENKDYKFTDVTVMAFKGNVQLGGFVDMGGQKAEAGNIAKNVPGVHAVENNITLRRQAAQTNSAVYVDDKTLESRVKSSLHNNPEYKFDDVKVAVSSGTVQLTGFVNTADQKDKAGDAVKRIDGVGNVVNNLVVKESLNQNQ